MSYKDKMTQEEMGGAVAGSRRVSGDCICNRCGKKYYDHPMEKRIKSYDGYPFLNRLCNGDLVKL